MHFSDGSLERLRMLAMSALCDMTDMELFKIKKSCLLNCLVQTTILLRHMAWMYMLYLWVTPVPEHLAMKPQV